MSSVDYSDLNLDNSAPKDKKRVRIEPRRVTGLSIAAFILGILSVPTALIPVFGVPISAVCIVVGIFAVWLAYRNGTQRAFAITGLVLAIIAMVASIVFWQIAVSFVEPCVEFKGSDFVQCMEEQRAK